MSSLQVFVNQALAKERPVIDVPDVNKRDLVIECIYHLGNESVVLLVSSLARLNEYADLLTCKGIEYSLDTKTGARVTLMTYRQAFEPCCHAEADVNHSIILIEESQGIGSTCMRFASAEIPDLSDLTGLAMPEVDSFIDFVHDRQTESEMTLHGSEIADMFQASGLTSVFPSLSRPVPKYLAILEILSRLLRDGKSYAATLSARGTWKFLVYCVDPSVAFARISNCKKVVFLQAKSENLSDLFDLEISFDFSTWAEWSPRIDFYPVEGQSLISQISRLSDVVWVVADVARKEEISRSIEVSSNAITVVCFEELFSRSFQVPVFLFDALPGTTLTVFESKEISRFFHLRRILKGNSAGDDKRRNFQVALLSCVSSAKVIFSRNAPVSEMLPSWLQYPENFNLEISIPKPKRKRAAPKAKAMEIVCLDVLEDAPISPRFPRYPEEEISRSLIESIPRPFSSRLRLCRAK